MHEKKLASTLMKKNLIVTITVVTALSLGILTGCGAVQHANADPLTNPTQIEQTVEDETETQDSSEATQETSESTQEVCEHNWVEETYYTTEIQTVHHDAETTTVVDKEAYDEQVVDKAAWDETVTTYTTETQTIHHDAVTHTVHHDEVGHLEETDIHYDPMGYDCTWEWVVDSPAWDEIVVDTPAWDEQVTVQIPHTSTVHHDATYKTVHHEAQTHTETVDAYDEEVEVEVPHTHTVCTECGEEKK
jgi:hypothetical protein